ncbi:MAG: hypothetical protein H8D45_20895 [Bacteroidetes bacterium]|nr:hypothetical protein [Bacteroidota bacterium]
MIQKIKTMEASKDMDMLLSRTIMASKDEHEGSSIPPHRPKRVPEFSKKIKFAWHIVEKLQADGWLVTIKVMPEGFPFIVFDDNKVMSRAVCELLWMDTSTTDNLQRRLYRNPVAFADTAPLAICRAALLTCLEHDSLDFRHRNGGLK